MVQMVFATNCHPAYWRHLSQSLRGLFERYALRQINCIYDRQCIHRESICIFIEKPVKLVCVVNISVFASGSIYVCDLGQVILLEISVGDSDLDSDGVINFEGGNAKILAEDTDLGTVLHF